MVKWAKTQNDVGICNRDKKKEYGDKNISDEKLLLKKININF